MRNADAKEADDEKGGDCSKVPYFFVVEIGIDS